MKFSENWLREWVNPTLTTEALIAQLTMAGLEVDAVEPVADGFTGVIVGEIISIEQHPDADKLRVCQVAFGESDPIQVVCGAPNARAGLKVPFARVGAVLPKDFKIKKAKLRGVESFGMLCGASELGMEDVIDGLMELPADAPVGEDLRSFLSLDDQVIDVDLTPNRGDCLSIAGIAREVGVLNDVPVTPLELTRVPVTSEQTFEVQVSASQDCPVYCGRVIENVDVVALTPLWMVEKLRRSGIRSIDPIVDVTNYVLLELGQPMHAFDLDQLQGGIEVRKAAANEKLTLLDGQELTLKPDDLVIADQSRALALAGIMGGQNSGVNSGTQHIFLESAFFAPIKLAGRARSYGLHTDSSHRFERGVDWQLQEKALERATELIVTIAGGKPGPVVKKVADELTRNRIKLTVSRLDRLLGFVPPGEEVTRMLEGLGIDVTRGEGDWNCVVPSFRFDLAIEEDLVEEIARLYGYNRLPVRPLALPVAFSGKPEKHTPLMSLKHHLVALGYQEAITYSFTASDQQAYFSNTPGIAIQNPISSDMSEMRQSLIPGLIQSLQHNLNRQQQRVRLFESGLVFHYADDGFEQKAKLAGMIAGSRWPENWATGGEAVDFFDIKGDVESLLSLIRAEDLNFTAEEVKGLHPGQCAAMTFNGKNVGVVGALHPSVLKALGISQTVFVFELSLDILSEGNVTKFKSISRYPSVRRDLAFIVDESVVASEFIAAVRDKAGSELTDCSLFDVYTGAGVDEGKKSLALGLTFRHQARSLSDSEVQAAIDVVVEVLGQEYGATLRN